MSSEQPKRRSYQFSLKTLLIVMTVAIVSFGVWVQYRRHRAQVNWDRVATIETTERAILKLGGVATYGSYWPKISWLELHFEDPGNPGEAYFLAVHFNDRNVTDDDLQHLKELKELKSLQRLHLNNTNVTDAGLEHLKGLTNLRYLDLRGTNATDEGVKELQHALPNCTIERSPSPAAEFSFFRVSYHRNDAWFAFSLAHVYTGVSPV